MQQQTTVVWLAESVCEACRDEARSQFPRETGGAFMGYWADQQQVVITKSIGPGPNATHRRYSFEPDYEWQQSNIESHYVQSRRYDTYLGDWHTHPEGVSGWLSHEDKRALRRVAESKSARAPTPISMIFYGGPDEWHVTCWCASIVARKFMWARLETWAAETKIF